LVTIPSAILANVLVLAKLEFTRTAFNLTFRLDSRHFKPSTLKNRKSRCKVANLTAAHPLIHEGLHQWLRSAMPAAVKLVDHVLADKFNQGIVHQL
jgi:hypothetical protein